MYFSENCAHDSQSNSPAQAGSSRPRSRLNYSPVPKARLLITATPSPAPAAITRSAPHAPPFFRRGRNHAFGGFRLERRIVHLHEIKVMRTYKRFHPLVPAFLGGRDADVAHAPGVLPLPKDAKIGFRIHQAVNHHQVERTFTEQSLRSLQRLSARTGSPRADLRGYEERIDEVEFREESADDLFGISVTGGGIDQRAAMFHQGGKDCLQFSAAVFGYVVEFMRGAQSDNGNVLAGSRDFSPVHLGSCCLAVSGNR